jgi:hypothetical protein
MNDTCLGLHLALLLLTLRIDPRHRRARARLGLYSEPPGGLPPASVMQMDAIVHDQVCRAVRACDNL